MSEEDLQPAFILELDRLRFGVLRDGAPVEPAQPKIGHGPPMFPLAGVRVAEPGTLRGRDKPFEFRPHDADGIRVQEVACTNGPAVWLRSMHDWFVTTTAPQQLAQEIERRRRRVARLGGFAANEVWQRAPSLRETGPDGPRPGRGRDTPDYPPSLTHGVWQPMTALPVSEPSAGIDAEPPGPPSELPYPERLRDYEIVLRSSGPPLRLTVTARRLLLSQDPVLGEPSVVTEPPVPPSAATVPLAALHVVRAGRLTGMSPRLAQRWFTQDARSEIRLDRVDGPALWLWGPMTEWLICTPDAADLAADIRLRQWVSMRYPISSDLGPERRTWYDLPMTRPVDTGEGRTLPPPPAYAPASPTVVPPGAWQPLD
ncbi:hypothetical protein [Gandjariella thermophila]|uniref:hypothetical protein n=1 Tax=Gandjariella thermophila TaxID=1931992 RepID=UPI0010F71E1B|nr:hypothetical protein [Gandjariella thermophila]